MTRLCPNQSGKVESGATLIEFSIAASVFFLALFGVLEVGRLLWTHNALTDAAHRGTRYAALHQQANQNNSELQNIQNIVVYGTTSPAVGAQPLVPGLTTSMVTASYSSSPNFGVHLGTVTVAITGYTFNFSVPLIGSSITMPAYKSTMTGESAGI